jgi:hypothetical protein
LEHLSHQLVVDMVVLVQIHPLFLLVVLVDQVVVEEIGQLLVVLVVQELRDKEILEEMLLALMLVAGEVVVPEDLALMDLHQVEELVVLVFNFLQHLEIQCQQ